MGLAYLNLKQHERAIEFARKAIQHPNATFWAYSVLASAQGHLGNIEEARKALDKLMELEPRYSPEFVNSIWPKDEGYVHQLDGLRKAGLDIPDEPAPVD